jgi:hypothetical protein
LNDATTNLLGDGFGLIGARVVADDDRRAAARQLNRDRATDPT